MWALFDPKALTCASYTILSQRSTSHRGPGPKKRIFTSSTSNLVSCASSVRSYALPPSNTSKAWFSTDSASLNPVKPRTKDASASFSTSEFASSIPRPESTSSHPLAFEKEDTEISDVSSIYRDENIRVLHRIASKLPMVHNRVIEGHAHRFRPQKMTNAEVSLLGEIVKTLDAIVTQNIPLTPQFSLDLLRIVQAFPDQICHWSNLHLIEPRSRSAQLWPMGVLQALARLQHPLTIEAWKAIQETDLQLPIGLYIELCHYFGLPPDPTEINAKSRDAMQQLKAERAKLLQSVLLHARATGNSVVILTCWSHTIRGLLSQGDITGAEREWHALLRMKVSPQIELLQAFIQYYSKHVRKNPQYADKVAALHIRLKQLNISPDLQTYSDIVKCYERSMLYKEMDNTLVEMTKRELKLRHPESGTPRLAVKGPRATLLQDSDLDDDDWPAVDDQNIAESHTNMNWHHSEPKIDAMAGSNASKFDAALHPSVPLDSAISQEKSLKQSDLMQEVVTDASTSIEQLKAKVLETSQKTSTAPLNLKIGSIVYTGGAQWAGGGRKQPSKSRMAKSIENQLLSTTDSFPDSVDLSNPLSSDKSLLGPNYTQNNALSSSNESVEADLLKRHLKIVNSWSRAIYHALSLGSLQKAMYLVQEMESLGLHVNDRICTEFMYYAGKHSDVRLLRRWWSRLRRIPNYALLRKHYLIFMRELLRIDEPQEARKIMAHLCQQYGHADDVYALWLHYYASKGLSISIEMTLKQMEAHRVEYGAYCTSALMDLFARKGNLPEMFSWFERLKAKSRSSDRMIDDVISKCVHRFRTEKHPIDDVQVWLDALPNAPERYPRFLGALLVTLGMQHNVLALDHIASLASQVRSTFVLVGMIRGYSYMPDSPKRDHIIMETLNTADNIKYQLTAHQNEDILQSLTELGMPSVLLDWQEDLIGHPSHVTEPNKFIFPLLAAASLAAGTPERFVNIATKSAERFSVKPPFNDSMDVIRAVCATRDVNRILVVTSPLVELYASDPKNILIAFDQELSAAGLPRPQNVSHPSDLANPSTLDIPSYISRRLGM